MRQTEDHPDATTSFRTQLHKLRIGSPSTIISPDLYLLLKTLLSTTSPGKFSSPRPASPRSDCDPAQTEKPLLGIFYFVLYTLLKALSYVVVQMLYNREEELGPFQMLYIRSIFGLGIMCA